MRHVFSSGWVSAVLGSALVYLLSPNAHSATMGSFKSFSTSPPSRLYLGLGMINYDMARYSASASGGTSLFARLIPEVNASYRWTSSRMTFAPTISYTVLGFKDVDTNRARLLTLTAPVSYSIDAFDIHGGPGVLWYHINGSGNGGKISLANGTGTSDFYTPNSSFNSRLLLLDLGIGYEVSKVRVDFDAYVTDTFSTRRAVTTVFNLSYGFLE